MDRTISKDGLSLIKTFEGLRLKAYKPVKTEKYWTIGYGHYGKDVIPNMVITKEQAEKMLIDDCNRIVKHVNKYQKHYNFNQSQFDALCSFAFNIGNIDGLTKNGTRSIKEIEQYIPKYNKSNGVQLSGLVKRREYELALFKKGVTSEIYYPAYEGTSLSIVDALKSVGEKDASFNHRKEIAKKNGVLEYKGLPKQNELLLSLLIIGKLLK